MSEKKKAEEVLAELGRKIDELIAEAKTAGKGVADDLEDKISHLKDQKEELEMRIKEGLGQSNEKWTEIREHLNEAAEALHKAFRSLLNKS